MAFSCHKPKNWDNVGRARPPSVLSNMDRLDRLGLTLSLSFELGI